jgi:hypothetical protein
MDVFGTVIFRLPLADIMRDAHTHAKDARRDIGRTAKSALSRAPEIAQRHQTISRQRLRLPELVAFFIVKLALPRHAGRDDVRHLGWTGSYG